MAPRGGSYGDCFVASSSGSKDEDPKRGILYAFNSTQNKAVKSLYVCSFVECINLLRQSSGAGTPLRQPVGGVYSSHRHTRVDLSRKDSAYIWALSRKETEAKKEITLETLWEEV